MKQQQEYGYKTWEKDTQDAQKIIKQLSQQQKPGKLLDLGGGHGRLRKAFLKLGYSYYLADSDKSLKHNIYPKKIEFILKDTKTNDKFLKKYANCFDIIWIQYLFMFVSDSQVSSILEKLLIILSENGMVVVIDNLKNVNIAKKTEGYYDRTQRQWVDVLEPSFYRKLDEDKHNRVTRQQRKQEAPYSVKLISKTDHDASNFMQKINFVCQKQ